MMKKIFLILLLISFIVSACDYQKKDLIQELESGTGDAYPSISTILSPTNPSLGESFSLTINAEDEEGVDELSWLSSKLFSNYDKTDSFDCKLAKTCSYTWELISGEEGLHEITAVVKDSSGKKSKVLLKADIQPYVERKDVVKSTAIIEDSPVREESKIKDDSCSSNSDCGYKQKCKSGNCVTVECTTSSQCSGCRRCSSNQCVSCGKGPYGCYC